MIRLLIALSLLLAACSGGDSPPPPPPPPALASTWIIAFSPGMPTSMQQDANGNWYVILPQQNGLHYVYRGASAYSPFGMGSTVRMRFLIEGNGKIMPTEGDASARVRLFMQQIGDTLTAQEPHKRWWSTAYADLTPGERELSAVIEPGKWSNVFGQNGAEVPGEFANMLSQIGNIGFTFGGMFAGHGVYVTGGEARFTLKTYEAR